MTTTNPAPAGHAKQGRSATYRNYALGILLVVYTFNFIDRQILGILGEAIKTDLGLSDTQLGFLTGFAFALFYATLGIPIARLADKGNRVNIVSAALATWSLMTALSGAVGNFWQLALARIGVGIGEAGCSPPAHSLISDYFSREKRATAMGIYSLGIPIGTLFGFLVGGWINEYLGWRAAFFVVGIPGVLLAILVRMTLREPPRESGQTEDAPPLSEVARTLYRQSSFRHISFGAAMAAFTGYGLVVWLAPFYIRIHELSTVEISTVLALGIGVAGGLGTLLGGQLSDHLAKKHDNVNFYVWLPAIALGVAAPFLVAALLVGGSTLSFTLLIVPFFLNSVWYGPTFSMVQSLVQPRMRATATSILFLIINLIGLGLGPQLIGIASDLLRPSVGIDSLRYALVGAALVYLWSAFHYVRAAKNLAKDLSAVENRPETA